jgi:hypothetical protein
MLDYSQVLELHKLGWRLVPAPRAGKSPMGSWKSAQTEPATDDEIREAFEGKDRNVFLITGAISKLAVLDCDDRQAVAYWRDKLGDVLDRTACVSTGKGKHFYFSLAEGEAHRGRSSPGGKSGKWDLRAEGGGVVAPPSIHPSGRKYRWIDGKGPESVQPAPEALWAGATEESGEKGPRSLLSHLLANPPTEGNRNNWLAQVAGHFAKNIPHQDAYEAMVREAAEKVPGLDEDEIDKLIHSIWNAERAKLGKAQPADADSDEGGDWRIAKPEERTGWIISGDTRVLAQVRNRDGEGAYQLELSEWMDADMRVLAVVEEEELSTFEVEIRRHDGGVIEASLPTSALGDARQLRIWLAQYGVSLTSPEGIHPRGMNDGARLLRYLRAQDAPRQSYVTTLGWSDKLSGFVTMDGVLKLDGFQPFDALRPHPTLKSRAPYRYGLEGEEYEAGGILREIMTFHHERVCAVFGSWWAACLVKPQLFGVFSQFPIMALEAPSESGKSTGFFPLMLELSGNYQGEGVFTKAALRDYLSAHRNGIVWLDDLDNLENYWELMRGATVGGSVAKKALNQSDQVNVQLHAAMAISGEALGLKSQKALADRSVHLEVPSPVGRHSLRGDYVQWQDIVTLKEHHPDLTDYSGTLVLKAIRLIDQIPKQALKMRAGSGRQADKLTIVKMGSWVLRELMGDSSEWITRHVDEWIEEQLAAYSRDDNALTLDILPQCLRRTGHKSRPEGPDPARRQIATPAWVADEEVVWFSPSLLAEWWADLKYGRTEVRTTSEEALTQQAKAIGAGGKKGFDRRYHKYATGGGGANYWKLPDHLSLIVLERSRGS